VYAEDRDAGRKHDQARAIVLGLWNDQTGVVSVQVLQELYVTLTRKLPRTMSPGKALEIVREYLTWQVVDNTGELLVDAVTLQQKAGLSFGDALIVQAGINAGCNRLYSEDLNAGQRFAGMEIVNPFSGP
jgi:predicted nucleic acid-binding protein